MTGMLASGLPFSSTTWPETSVEGRAGSVTVIGSTIVPVRESVGDGDREVDDALLARRRREDELAGVAVEGHVRRQRLGRDGEGQAGRSQAQAGQGDVERAAHGDRERILHDRAAR